MKPTIRNLPREAAEAFEPGPGVVCISITQPGHPARLSRKFELVLRVEFSDWDLDRYTVEAGQKNPANAASFTEQQARHIAAIVRFAVDAGHHLVVHCDAGISRSGAVVDAALRAFPGHFADEGYQRHPNNYVRRLLLREFGMVPAGLIEA